MPLSYQDYLDEKKKRGTVQPTSSSLSYDTYQSQRQQANLTPSQRAREELKTKEQEKPSFFNKVKTAASNFFGELSGKKKDERLQQLKPLEVPTTTPETAQPLQVAQNNIIDDFITREKTVSAQLTPEAQVKTDEFTLASIQKLKTINERSKPILTEIAKRTSGTGIVATIKAADPEVTFKQAYEVMRKSQQEKDDTLPEQFLTGLLDTGPQTALGVALAFVPIVGKPLSTSYWAAVSAGSEIEEKGYATPTNVAIDVIGDRILGGMMEKLFKVPAKALIKIVKEAFVVEGGTEVAQDLLKFGNDYRLAKSDQERGAVIDSAKNYFTSGQILVTAAVGGVAGGGIAAVTTGASRIIRITPDATQETVEISNLSDTEAGDALIEMSEKAKSEGREVVVDTSGLSGEIVVNTPEGNPIGIGLGEKVVEPKTAVIEEKEPEKQPKVGEEEIMTSPEALETTKKEGVVSEEVGKQEQTPIQDLNRKLSEKNTEQVVKDTLAGLREDQRIANDKLLKQFQLYNQKYNKTGITSETEVTVYRVGSKEIDIGDHVTVSKLNATNYLNQRVGAELYETTAKIKDLVFSEGKKDEFIYAPYTLEEEKEVLRGTKGMTADDIMKTYPNIQLKRDVTAKDISGNKIEIEEGEKLTPYELTGNKILLQDGETYIVSKNQFQNIKGQSKVAEGKPFAPELETVEETIRGTEGTNEELKKLGYEIEQDMDDDITITKDGKEYEYEDLPPEIQSLIENVKEATPTKYYQYTLPGGENYREILIKAKDTEGDEFKSSHWEEPNVISHLRINEREYEKDKVLFMEELQSDWAREGRDKGFETWQKPKDVKSLLPEGWSVETGDTNYVLDADGNRVENKLGEGLAYGGTVDVAVGKAIGEERLMGDYKPGVPFNPLLKNWQEITLKRALQEAIKVKAKYFAWINGEQTTARYNLSTQIENINWEKSDISEGENLPDKRIFITPKTGGSNITVSIDESGVVQSSSVSEWKGKKLDEIIGKGLADKIMADGQGRLSGEGLKFGGEWANTLYDKQVKNIVEDLTGKKVEVIDMGLPISSESPRFDLLNEDNAVVGPLTPETLKVGVEILAKGENNYIITDVMADGKFKAISASKINKYLEKTDNKVSYKSFIELANESTLNDLIGKESFDISPKKSEGQQSIKITPEVEMRIKGKAPKIETSMRKFEEKKVEPIKTGGDLMNEVKKYLTLEELKNKLSKSTWGDYDVLKMEVPISKITGAEPTNAYSVKLDAGRKITKPVEIAYNFDPKQAEELGQFVLVDGNHRLAQAIANGQKTIVANVGIANDYEGEIRDKTLPGTWEEVWNKVNFTIKTAKKKGKKTKVLTVKQAERELEKARKLNKIMELKEVSKKKVKSKPLSMKYKKELQTMVSNIVNSSKPQQEVVTDIDNFMHDLNQKADDPTYNNQLKAVRAEMKRQMYKVTDIDTGNWKRDYAFFQVARNNPEVEQIVDKLEEQVFEISDKLTPNAPAGPGYASTGSEVIDNFEKRDVPKKGTKEFKMREKVIGLVRKYAETIGERYTPRKALGVYYGDTKNIRVNAINNLSVATHEITHFLDFQYHISDKLMEIKGFSKNGRPIYSTETSGLRKEITNLYMQYYPGGKKTHSLRMRTLEGFATLLQKYSEAPNRITSEYPKLVQQFLKPGGKYYQPIMSDILTDLNEIIVEYQGLSSLDKIGSKVANEKANVDKKSFLSFWDQVRTQLVDAIYPIEVLAKKVGKVGTVDDPSIWVRAYNAVSGIINNNIATNRGYYRLKDGDIKKTSKENWKTLVDLTVKRKNSHDFGYYLVARREHFAYLELDTAKERLDQLTEQLNEMKEKGENPYDVVNDDGQTFVDEFLQAKDAYVKLSKILKNDGFSRDEIDTAYSENKERFAQEEKLYDMLVREDLEMMREVGLVSASQYEKLSSQQGYASFKREFYDEIVGDFDGAIGPITVGKTKVSSLIGRKGSERTIINPLYNGMASHSEVMRKVLKQVVYNKIGAIGVSAALPTTFQKLQLKVAKDKNTGAILYPQERDPNIIMARDENGKRVPILVDKQVKSIVDDVLTYKNVEVFEKLYLGLSRMFTAGTTGLYPQFAATNFVVDQITAQVNSNNKYKAFYSSLSKLKLVVTKKGGKDAEYLQEYLVMGGERQTFTGWQKLSPDALFNRINGEKKGIEKAIELLDKGVDIAATPSKYSELVSRAAEYIAARKAGKPAIVALEDAGRVTAPFHHVGKWGGRGGKTFIRGLPFFNATLQVLDQSIRTYNTESGRKRTLGMVTVITAAYLASMLAMLDADDEQKEQYRDLEAEDLTNFLHLPMPGGKKLFRIKMSQTFSAFGAVLNMIIADTLMGTSYKPKEYLAAATAILPDQFNPLEPTKAFLAWLPQVFKPGIETAFGVKSYPKVRSLEGMALERLPAEFRFNENTSKFAKWLGDKLKLSPIKIDHLLTGYFGRASGFLTGKPSATDLTSSVIRDYFFTYGRRVAATYELGTEAEQDYNAYQKGIKEVEDPDELYRMYMLTNDFEEIMRDYRKIDIETDPEKALEMRNEALKIMNMIETGEKPKGFHSWTSDAEKRRRKNLRELKKTESALPVEEKKPFSFKLVKEAYAAEGLEGTQKKLTWSKDIRTKFEKFLGKVNAILPGDQKREYLKNPIEGITAERLNSDQKREYYNAMLALRESDTDWYYRNMGNKVEKRILGFDLGKEEEVRESLKQTEVKPEEEIIPTGTAREGVGEAVDDDVTYKGLIQRKPDESTDKVIKENTKDGVAKPQVVAAMLWQESGYKPDARNDGGENGVDRGIAQINSKSHPEVSDEQADDTEFAINWLVEELKRNLKKFDGDINRAIAAHNVGPTGAETKGDTPSGLGPRGQTYVDNVARNLSPELRKELGIKTRYN